MRRLAWFEEHQGETTLIPGPLEDGLLLVSKPKGIYKPQDLPYALSIRINVGSPYEDGLPVPAGGGGWLLSYHQERADPGERDTMFTNRGLMQCIADQVPVGVLRARAGRGRSSQYEVLGLAVPVKWSDGYFFLESLDPAGVPSGEIVSDVLEATARAALDQQEDGDIPADDYDARLRAYRQIVARQGQSGFRASLFEAYQGRCAITGCDTRWVLEAAHLRPYRGPDSNTVTNGLLLRSDLHTLLDLRLLAVEPQDRTIVLSKLLAGTDYEPLSGQKVTEPAARSQRPSHDALARNWQGFLETEQAR